MFLSTLYLSISRSIDGGPAFSTVEIWSCVFQSRELHPCDLVPRIPVLRFPPPYFLWSRVYQSRIFSVSAAAITLSITWQCLILQPLTHMSKHNPLSDICPRHLPSPPKTILADIE